MWQQTRTSLTAASVNSGKQVVLVDQVFQLSHQVAPHAAALVQLFTGQTVSAELLSPSPQGAIEQQQQQQHHDNNDNLLTVVNHSQVTGHVADNVYKSTE